jgi:hypothetical protein
MLAAVLLALSAVPAAADGDLSPEGLTFKDFSVADNGASFNRTDPMLPAGPDSPTIKLLGIDTADSLARIRFNAVKVEAALPLGWQATEDWERGVAYSADRQYRLILWRVDFAFEGVKDAEQYAAAKIGVIRSRRQGVTGQARKLTDGSFLIVYESVPPEKSDQSPRTVFDLLLTNPGDPKTAVLLTLGVPTKEASRGLSLLALMKQKVKIDW